MGTDGPDTLTGQATGTIANRLLGYDGNDVIEGRGGNDNLSGGDGSDTLRGGIGNDLLSSVDEAADAAVDCGDGTGDRALHDAGLDAPVGCEALEPF
jgi:Ca2+-binding RTX toxin-like protein